MLHVFSIRITFLKAQGKATLILPFFNIVIIEYMDTQSLRAVDVFIMVYRNAKTPFGAPLTSCLKPLSSTDFSATRSALLRCSRLLLASLA
jgi:hypothetical protein